MRRRALLLLLAFLAAPAAAERVVLDTGKVLEGEILQDTATALTLKTAQGVLEIPRDRIRKVTRGDPNRPPPPPAPAPTPRPGPAPEAVPPAGEAQVPSDLGGALARLDADENAPEAEQAARELTAMGPKASAFLAAAFAKASPRQQRWIALIVAEIGHASGHPVILEGVHSPHVPVRLACLQGLDRLPGDQGFRPAMNLLRDTDWQVRLESVRALAAIGKTDAVPALIARLEDDQTLVRGAAHDALVQLTEETLPLDPEAWREWLRAHPIAVQEHKDLSGRPIDTRRKPPEPDAP